MSHIAQMNSGIYEAATLDNLWNEWFPFHSIRFCIIYLFIYLFIYFFFLGGGLIVMSHKWHILSDVSWQLFGHTKTHNIVWSKKIKHCFKILKE